MDTFFKYYFIIVGGFFVLSLIHECIKFLVQDQDDWQFELANDVLNWCLELYPLRKQKPKLTLVDGESKFAGEYNYSQQPVDWTARAAALMADAEEEVQAVIASESDAVTATMPTMFTSAKPYTVGGLVGGRGR